MHETNLLHYIQSGDFVDHMIDIKTYAHIYADVGHLFPNCTQLSQYTNDITGPILVILSRLTVAQLLEMYDIATMDHVTVINLRVGVAGIGHKFTTELDDIALMTGHGRTVYEPVSLNDLNTISQDTTHHSYIRITHRHLPAQLDLRSRHGMRYQGELSQSVTYFPASMIEAVGGLDSESQTSQYVLLSDWSGWYLSDEFREVASLGGTSIIVMEQSTHGISDYIDTIQSLYPKHRILGISVGTDIREGDVIVDEYRDERYGCDTLSLGRKVKGG